MKKHLIKVLLILCGTLALSSCLKDDPENNPTVYYAYQYIPNINEFMPQRLLYAFGNEQLHFGDEPPRIEGIFKADDISISFVDTTGNSTWMQTNTLIPTPQYFQFYEQHKGVAKMKFRYPKGTPGEYNYFLEKSSTKMTDSIMKWKSNSFVEDTISPSYFKDGKLRSEDFRRVFIMGEDPYFTVYYYEIRDISSKGEPLNAVIFTGKIEKETITVTDTVNNITETYTKPVIKNLKWGIQTMKYYKETASLNQIIHLGFLPTPGDLIVLSCGSDTHTVSELPH